MSEIVSNGIEVGQVVINISGKQWHSGDFASYSMGNYNEFEANSKRMTFGVVRKINLPMSVCLIEIAPGEFTSKEFSQLEVSLSIPKNLKFLQQFAKEPEVNDKYNIF